jgi:SnoaL-like domain
MSKNISEVTQAIAALLTEFYWRIDNDQGGSVAELHTEDATVDTPFFALAGRQAIHELFSHLPPDRHGCHSWLNLRVVDKGDGRYLAQTNTLAFIGVKPAPCQGAQVMAGTATDLIIFDGDRPLFATRHLYPGFDGRIVAVEQPAGH